MPLKYWTCCTASQMRETDSQDIAFSRQNPTPKFTDKEGAIFLSYCNTARCVIRFS
jgi:hypothetical protein